MAVYSPRSQYTVRNVSERVDRVLRRRAQQSGRSLNQVVLEALSEGAGERQPVFDDLDFMIGSMKQTEVKALDREIAQQRRVDRKLWR